MNEVNYPPKEHTSCILLINKHIYKNNCPSLMSIMREYCAIKFDIPINKMFLLRIKTEISTVL